MQRNKPHIFVGIVKKIQMSSVDRMYGVERDTVGTVHLVTTGL